MHNLNLNLGDIACIYFFYEIWCISLIKPGPKLYSAYERQLDMIPRDVFLENLLLKGVTKVQTMVGENCLNIQEYTEIFLQCTYIKRIYYNFCFIVIFY